jgi:hypothetical protein
LLRLPRGTALFGLAPRAPQGGGLGLRLQSLTQRPGLPSRPSRATGHRHPSGHGPPTQNARSGGWLQLYRLRRTRRKGASRAVLLCCARPCPAPASLSRCRLNGSASFCVELGRCCMRGRETASGRMEKSAVWAPRAEAEGLDCRARRSWLDRLVGQPRRRRLSNLWYGVQFPAWLVCPVSSGLAGARDLGLDPGHAEGRRLAPGRHASHVTKWGVADRHAQAGQRPGSAQSEAEPR